MKRWFSSECFVILGIFVFSISACKKADTYASNATIIGYDLKMCPCCGGMEIVIDNALNPSPFAYYLIGDIPASFNLGTNPEYPILVKIDYQIDTVVCNGHRVNITRIAKR